MRTLTRLTVGLALSSAGCSLVFPSDGYADGHTDGSMSFAQICQSSDVIRCFTFDSDAELDALYAPDACAGTFANCYGQIDGNMHFEGEGALRIRIPSERSTGRDPDVAYFGLNFTPGSANEQGDETTVHVGPGEALFISWRQRITAQMLALSDADGEGYASLMVTQGDYAGQSASLLELDQRVVVGPSHDLTYPRVRGWLRDSDNCTEDGFTEPDSQDRELIQNIAECTEDNDNGTCVSLVSDQWTYFELGLTVGDWDTDSTRARLWIAHAGEPAQLLIDVSKPLCMPANTALLAAFGKVWLAPYLYRDTDMPDDGFIWYDNLAISRQPLFETSVSQ